MMKELSMEFKRVTVSSQSVHLFFGLFFFGLLLTSSISAAFIAPSVRSIYSDTFDSTETSDVEYWALLIAVGVYEFVPEMDRPTMLQEVANFEDLLLSTKNFDADHIKVIKAEDATVINIAKGFRWLDDHEDENDFSLVYLTTHGFPHWWDRPPFDESDGRDEALATYRGFLPIESPFRWEHMSNPFGIILDDQFNHWFVAIVAGLMIIFHFSESMNPINLLWILLVNCKDKIGLWSLVFLKMKSRMDPILVII